MRFAPIGGPAKTLKRGFGQSSEYVRVPAGHPEGYLEAFANLYTDIADILQGQPGYQAIPDIHDGMEGMRFIATCIQSSRDNGNWTSF